jgi:phosphoglycerate dehydrogenase-like enzyme
MLPARYSILPAVHGSRHPDLQRLADNGPPVAEFTVAMITLANKGALPAMRLYQTESMAESNKPTRLVYPGTYQTAVGILGAGAIGSLVIRMLQAYPVDLMVYDPFISRERWTV